jgi:hypothetical protein
MSIVALAAEAERKTAAGHCAQNSYRPIGEQQAIRSHNGASGVVEPSDRPVHFISWDAGENVTRRLIRNIYDPVLTFAALAAVAVAVAVAVASTMMAKQVIALIILSLEIPLASK